MKIFKLIIFALLFIGITANSFAQDTITWRSDYKLKWDDFKGKPDSSSQFGAISYCTIKYLLSTVNNSYSYKVFCFFNKSISWTKGFDSIGLKHEQGHFDIAELFARRLKKKFREYKANIATIKQDFKILFEENNKERDKMDNLYDKETNFSRNKPKQAYWNKKILAELKKLEGYKE
jgi:hypothetical protein